MKSKGQEVTTDRLGSVRWAREDGWRSYFPYGEERWASNDNREKFGTYVRDNSMQDYADQRYHGPGTGRFFTPDLYLNNTGLGDPSGWNRYAYTRGEPVNLRDPAGLADCDPDGIVGRVCPYYEAGGGDVLLGQSKDAYNQYVTRLNTYTITAAPSLSGENGENSPPTTTVLGSYTVVSPVPLPNSAAITVTGENLPFVWSSISFGNEVLPPSSGQATVTQWSVDINLLSQNVGVPHDAFSGTIGGFGLFGVLGGYVSINYVPQTNTLCVGLNGGVGTPGIVASAGTLSTGPGTDVQSVIEGFSISLSGNLPGGPGGQAQVNPGSGTAVDASYGTPGVSLTVGGSVCFH